MGWMKAKKDLEDGVRESIGAKKAPAVKIAETPAADPRWLGVARSKAVVQEIDLERIAPDPDQPRKEIAAEAIAEMAASLRARGQLSPAAVYWDELESIYRLVFGERRWRAAREAGFNSLKCEVLEERPDVGRILALQIVENDQREDLAPLDRARSYARALELNGWTQAKFCEETGLKAANVSKALALLKLDERVQDAIADGRLDWSVAFELRFLESGDEQWQFAEDAIDQDWSGAFARDEVGFAIGRKTPPGSSLPDGQTAPTAATSAPGQTLGVSGGNFSSPRKAPSLPAEWRKRQTFTVTLDDGREVKVEYDGLLEADHQGTFRFTGPGKLGPFESRIWESWVDGGKSVVEFAEQHARKRHGGWVGQAEFEVRRKAEERRHDKGLIEGWDRVLSGAGASFSYGEAFDEDGDPADGPWLELNIDERDWSPAVAVLERALAKLKWRAELAAVQPDGARPGDVVELVRPEPRLKGKRGRIQERDGRDGLWVRFAGMPGEGGVELRPCRGEALRRIGPGPGKAEEGGDG